MATVGENIRKIRKERGLTQEELAKLIGISRNYYSEIENGKKFPSLSVIEKINKEVPLIFLNYDVDNSIIKKG